MKRQHATLTLVDTEDGTGFTAQVNYQPSLKNRHENSPAVNAMIRLCIVIGRAKESLAAPLERNVTQKPLTKWEKARRFVNARFSKKSIRQERRAEGAPTTATHEVTSDGDASGVVTNEPQT